MIWIGIDPGLSGGIAALFSNDGVAQVKRTPVIKPMPETEQEIATLLRGWGISYELIKVQHGEEVFAVIERVHSMPKQGVASTFKFGANYGFLRGCLHAFKIPFEEVLPQRWQKEMGCLTKGDKNVTKSLAQQLYPYLKITHATADAILIANWAMRFSSRKRSL